MRRLRIAAGPGSALLPRVRSPEWRPQPTAAGPHRARAERLRRAARRAAAVPCARAAGGDAAATEDARRADPLTGHMCTGRAHLPRLRGAHGERGPLERPGCARRLDPLAREAPRRVRARSGETLALNRSSRPRRTGTLERTGSNACRAGHHELHAGRQDDHRLHRRRIRKLGGGIVRKRRPRPATPSPSCLRSGMSSS